MEWVGDAVVIVSHGEYEIIKIEMSMAEESCVQFI